MAKLKLEYISIDKIDISKSNVRKTDIDKRIDELAKSIEKIGLQQPIVVFKDRDRYKLIIGQRRYLACKKLGLNELPAIVTHVKSETDATIASFSENIHRLDIRYRDKMAVSTALLNKLGSVNQVAEYLGVARQTVRNYLGYAIVPEPIKRMVDEKKLSASTALRIARYISDEKLAIRIAERIIEVPRSEDRRNIIYAARENPDKDLAEIFRIGEKMKFRRITINLSFRMAEALEQACRETGSDRKDIAFEAVVDWLVTKGFLG